jgi:hypothetical protein
MKNELAMMALEVAAENLGKTELTGKNDGAIAKMVQRFVAGTSKWLEGQPWCACFATWCVYEAAKRLKFDKPKLPKSASSTSLYAWFKKMNLLMGNNRDLVGCIGLVKGSGGTAGKTHHHTFLVEEVEGNYVYGIDGNYGNAVKRSKRLISDCDFGYIL